MRKTSPHFLIILGVAGGILGFVLEVELARRGMALFLLVPVYSIALIVFGLALLGLAWPIRKMIHDEKAKPVNPLWAVRVLLLAQASALASALLAGFSIGILLWMLTIGVLPLPTVLTAAFAVVASVALLIAALVAEHFCRLPPEDHDAEPTTDPTPTSY